MQADKPRYIAGHVSLCTNCGIMSEDLFRCQRCNHKLPMQPRPEPPSTTAGPKAVTCDTVTMTSKGIAVSPHIPKQVISQCLHAFTESYFFFCLHLRWCGFSLVCQEMLRISKLLKNMISYLMCGCV